MNPQIIAAGDGSRDEKSRFQSRAFWRAVRSVFPYRGALIVGLLASVGYAALHSVSILGVMPVLKVLLEEEGLHGWVDRMTAGSRLGFEPAIHHAEAGRADAGQLVVQRIRPDSPAYASGLREGWVFRDADSAEAATPLSWLKRVADAAPGAEVPIRAASPGEAGAGSVVHLTLTDAKRRWRFVRGVASMLPRDSSPDGQLQILTWVLAGVVIAVVIANVCRFVAEYYVSRAVLRALMDLRRKLYEKVLELPMSRFATDTGDLVSRFVQDIQDIQRGLLTLFGKSVREPLKAFFILGGALLLDWRITLTMLVVTPVAVFFFWRVGASIKKANRKLLRGYGTMIAALSTTLQSVAVVKAYTNENAERKRLVRIDREMFGRQLKIVRLQALMSPVLEVLGVGGVSVVAVWLGSRVISQELEVARFASLVVMLAMLFDPLRKLADVYTRVARSGAGAERLFEVLDAPTEDVVHPSRTVLPPLQDAIELRNVTFTYPGADAPALKNVSLRVSKGESVALVGRNGSGKTTLVNLIPRLYEPQEGNVCFDGVDINSVTLRSLRKQIGLVTQESVVFPITLAENIAYGTRNGSFASIEQAAKRAYADEFIRSKPDGYETVPGDRGSTLSGGQRQRIAIARAVLRDAPILIFDEATSQVDTESEQKIQTAVREFSKGRTTFVIAHRLSTIRFVDRIIVLDEGRLMDAGSHDELMQRCALYRSLCETQLLS